MPITEMPLSVGVYNYRFNITVDGVVYFFELTYNRRTALYTLNILDVDQNPILLGVTLLTSNTTIKYNMPELFGGLIIIIDDSGNFENGTIETMGDVVKVYHVDEDELVEQGL